MGDMADFELESVERAEEFRHKHRNHEMTIEESFELGFLDPFGAETEFLTGNKRVSKSYKTSWVEAQEKTQRLLESFRVFYLKRGFLSEKQKAIIDYNYSGGSVQFILGIRM